MRHQQPQAYVMEEFANVKVILGPPTANGRKICQAHDSGEDITKCYNLFVLLIGLCHMINKTQISVIGAKYL